MPMRRRTSIEDAPTFVRGRLKTVNVYRKYIAGRLKEFSGLKLFVPLIERCHNLDAFFEECERLLWRMARDEITATQLADYLSDEATQIYDIFGDKPQMPGCVRSNLSDDVDDAYNDAEELMSRVWSEVVMNAEKVLDALKGIDQRSDVAVPEWLS